MDPEIIEIFEKVTAAELKSKFGGPAGGSALERVSPQQEYFEYVTRRALALRVIRLQG